MDLDLVSLVELTVISESKLVFRVWFNDSNFCVITLVVINSSHKYIRFFFQMKLNLCLNPVVREWKPKTIVLSGQSA